MKSGILLKPRVLFFVILTFLSFSLFQNCSYLMEPDNTKNEELLNTDNAFSKLSEEKGMKFAFLEYAADDAVILRANSFPIEGKNAIAEDYKTFSDTGFILTWEPLYAEIAESGELGYTYGIYKSTSKDKEGNPTENKGTYVSIWKKDNKDRWKFVMDTGNEDLGD